MSLSPNPVIDSLEPCFHGGIDYTELEELGVAPEAVIDFGVNCNPFGPPPGIGVSLSTAAIERYPDSEAGELKRALAVKTGVAVSNLIVGNGSTELIRLVTLAYFGHEDLILIPQPTFGEYEVACRLVGARVLPQPMDPRASLQLEGAQVVKLIRKHQPQGIFLGNPNNPTGQYLSREEIEAILTASEHCMVILDEAYIAFVPEAWSSLDLIERGNLVILRSMTKDYALAGLRLGYAVAAEPIISALRRVQPPWSVNAVAQKAGLFALKADGYLEQCKTKLREAKGFLVKELETLGLFPLPSQVNFFLVEVGEAKKFRQALLRKGILVRDCTSFGLPDYIRLAPRTIAECQKLITAIKEIYHHAG